MLCDFWCCLPDGPPCQMVERCQTRRNGCMQNDHLGAEAMTEDAEEAVRV